MGIFGNRIGDIKNEHGGNYAYGWCDKCLGTKRGVFIGKNGKPTRDTRSDKCSRCENVGKRWYLHQSKTKSLVKDVFCSSDVEARFDVLNKKNPTDTLQVLGPKNRHEHFWEPIGGGVSGSRLPHQSRRLMRCSGCGAEKWIDL